MAGIINILILLLASLTLVVAPPPKTDYDVIVVGGGPAGLSAQSALCRVSRTSILFDDARYRNKDTRNMHDVIGNDGTPPDNFRKEARKQIAKYQTGLYRKRHVRAIFYQNVEGYRIFWAIDDTGAQYTARRVILATGVHDDLPNYLLKEGLFGKGIFWCPWCDAFEHRGQSLAITGKLSEIVGDVIEMKNINPKIVLLPDGSDTEEERKKLDKKLPGWQDLLRNAGVTTYPNPITDVDRLPSGRYEDLPEQCRTHQTQAPILPTQTPILPLDQNILGSNDGDPNHQDPNDPNQPKPEIPDPEIPDPRGLTGEPCTPLDKDAGPGPRHYDNFIITFNDSKSIVQSAILVEAPKKQRSTLPAQLALKMNDDDRVVIFMNNVSSLVAGVHAAGDMTNEGATNVPWAMYSGKKAAVFVHVAIAKEDAYDGHVPPPGLLKRSSDGEISERDAMAQAGNHMEKLWRRIEARHKK